MLSYGLNPPVYIDTGGGLGLHRVGYKVGDLHIRIAKLAFHAKESSTRTRDEVFSLVSSRFNSPDVVHSPTVRIPPNPGLPQPVQKKDTSVMIHVCHSRSRFLSCMYIHDKFIASIL